MIIKDHSVADAVSYQIIDKYNESANPKIIINGLTTFFAEQLHLRLRKNNIDSYLVVERGGAAVSESDYVVSEAGLVNIRNEHNKWIFIIPDNLIATLLESITNAKRSHVFKYEWPWTDEDKIVKFWNENGVVNSLLSSWGINDDVWKEKIRTLIDLAVLRSTRQVDGNLRNSLVIDEILGQFISKSNDNINIFKDFLFYLGIPPTNEISDNDTDDVKSELTSISKLIKNIRQTVANDDQVRKSVLDKLSKEPFQYEGSELTKYKELVNEFLDGLYSSKTNANNKYLGIRDGYVKCFNDPDLNKLVTWLNYENLSELFDFAIVNDPTAEFRVKFLINKEQCSSEDFKTLVAVSSHMIKIEFDAIRIPDFENNAWKISVNRGQKELVSTILEENTSNVVLEFDANKITTYRNPVRLTCKLDHGETKHASDTLKLNLIGDQREAIVFIGDNINIVKLGEDDVEIDVNEPSHINIASLHEVEVSVDGIDFPLSDLGNNFKKTSFAIDTRNYFGSRVDVDISIPEHSNPDLKSTQFTLLTPYPENGELTLDLELERLALGNNVNKCKKLLERFNGENSDFYSGLGGLEGAAIWRKELSSHFEESLKDNSYLPIVISIKSTVLKLFTAEGLNAYTNCNLEKAAKFRGALSSELLTLFDEYRNARTNLIETISENLSSKDPRSSHPLYACTPTFCKIHEEKIESEIANYLLVYANILNILVKPTAEAHERMVGLNLDTVYLIEESQPINLPEGIRLLGPWHPITVLRRFWMQKAMCNFITQYVVKSDVQKPQRNASFIKLLRENSPISFWRSFRDAQLPPAIISPTYDSGWLICLDDFILEEISKSDGNGNAARIFNDLTGFYLNGNLGDFEATAKRIINNYIHVFPVGRRLELDFSNGYSLGQATRIIREYLSFTEEQDKGSIFSYLSGGIHAWVQVDKDTYDESEAEDLLESKEPIYFYARNKNENINLLSDIHFRPTILNSSIKREYEKDLFVYHGLDEASLVVFSNKGIREDTTGDLAAVGVRDFQNNEDGKISKAISKINEVLLKSPNQDNNFSLVSKVVIERDNQSPWIFLPADRVDPAIIIKFLSKVTQPARALWEYKIDIESSNASYFLLSKADDTVKRAIKGLLPINTGKPDEIIREINKLGVALSAESQRTNNKAKGCIGVVGAARMLDLESIEELSLPDNVIATIIPVDSFESFFGKKITSPDSSDNQMDSRELLTDLMLIKFTLPNNENDKLGISIVAIEAKYASKKRSEKFIAAALEQAKATYSNMQDFVNDSCVNDALPFRMALVKLCEFSLRLRYKTNDEKFMECEYKIMKSIVAGNYYWKDERLRYLVVINGAYENSKVKLEILESSSRGAYLELDVKRDSIFWPKLNREHDEPEVKEIRKKIAELISLNKAPSNIESEIDITNVEKKLELSEGINDDSTTETTGELKSQAKEMVSATEKSDIKNLDKFECMLGANPSDGEKINWLPYAEPALANYGIAITGASGSGKTQLVKLITTQAAEANVPILVVDYKNDFWDDEFINEGNFERNDVSIEGLPFNPFELNFGQETIIRPIRQIHEIVDLFKSAYGNDMSHAMGNSLKRAIERAYEINGVNPKKDYQVDELDNKIWPDFKQVWEILINDEDIPISTLEALRSRLEPIDDLSFFPESNECKGGFEELANKRIVLSMKGIQSNQIRNLLSEIIIMRYHAHILREEGEHKFKRLLVFDEAWRISKSKKLGDLVRESRAFGLGLLLSSQSPDEFTDVLLNNMETKIFLKADQPKAMSIISKQLAPIMNSAERQHFISEISTMKTFQGYITNSQNKPYSRIDSRPFSEAAWDRLPEGHACLIYKQK